HGRLTPEQGAVWVRALEKAETELAFVENGSAQERSVAKRSAAGNDRMDDDYRARRADAMTHVLQQSLSRTSDSPGRTGDAFQVSVHVSAETLCGDELCGDEKCGDEKCGDEKSQSATIDGGPHLHPETIRRLTCDGALVSIFEDEDGDPLNVGRRTRVIPAAIHRGLKARDEECQYPGCSQTRFVEAHHIVHWAHGGETRLSNLMMLCTRHHRLVHELGYQVRRSGNGFEFVRPP
ncbi:MAG: HNH endonuclease, partial [Pseudomonadales bacterium]